MAVRARALTVVLAATLVAWCVTIWRMRGMDMGPGTNLGGLGWYLGIWVTMMAAMMLPSAAPMLVLAARATGRAVWLFGAGYLAVWTGFGLAAYGAARALAGVDVLAWNRAGPYVAGGAVALAGVYQLTPLKQACLRRCRSPLAFLRNRWREGPLGALWMGVEHGAWCAGCCWGLMLAVFALGVMSLLWMALAAAVILAEKALPAGERFAGALGLVLLGAGGVLAFAPASFPGLVQP